MVRAICDEAEVARLREASFNREALPSCQLSMARLPPRVQSALVQLASTSSSTGGVGGGATGGESRRGRGRRLMRGQITTPNTPSANVRIDVTYECRQCGGGASVGEGSRGAWSVEPDANVHGTKKGGAAAGPGGGAGSGGARTVRVDLSSGRPTNVVCPSTYSRDCDDV